MVSVRLRRFASALTMVVLSCGSAEEGASGIEVVVTHDKSLKLNQLQIVVREGKRVVLGPTGRPAVPSSELAEREVVLLRIGGTPDVASVVVEVAGIWKGDLQARGEAEATLSTGRWTRVEVALVETSDACDDLDNDSDGTVDEGCDDDNDDYCDGALAKVAKLLATCPRTAGAATMGDDCDDQHASVHPDAPEICDGMINDCNPSSAMQVAWVKQAGGISNDEGFGIALLENGGVAISGYYQDYATFGVGEASQAWLAPYGSKDIFLATYDSEGVFLTAWRAGGTLDDVGLAVAADSGGDLLLTGYFGGTATFWETVPVISSGESDVFLGRYVTDAHTLTWGYSVLADRGNAVALGSDGTAFVTGSMGGAIFVASYAPGDLNQDTSRAVGDAVAASYNSGNDLAVLPDGDVVVVGSFGGSATFDAPSSGVLDSDGASDAFILRVHSDMSFEWVKRVGGVMNQFAVGVAPLSDGGALVTGFFGGLATFGEGEDGMVVLNGEQALDVDFFLARYRADGTVVWARSAIGDSTANYSLDVVAQLDGGALITGSFPGSITFGSDGSQETALTSSTGGTETFVARYRDDGSFGWAQRIEGESNGGSRIVTLSDGSAVLLGWFSGSATFDMNESGNVTLTSLGGTDVFLAKYVPDGGADYGCKSDCELGSICE